MSQFIRMIITAYAVHYTYVFLAPSHLKMHVQGEGTLSDMYRVLISMFDPVALSQLDIDTTHCLPNPKTPDYNVYKLIGKSIEKTPDVLCQNWSIALHLLQSY